MPTLQHQQPPSQNEERKANGATNHPNNLTQSPTPQPVIIFILLFSVIGLAITSIFGGFNNDFNVFDIDFKLESKLCEWNIFNNGFNDIFDISGAGYIQSFNLCPNGAVGNVIDINNIFNGDVLSSLVIDTNGLSPPPPQPAINSSPIGVGLSQISVINNDLYAVSPPPIIIITNKCGPSWGYKYTTTIDTGVGLDGEAGFNAIIRDTSDGM